MAVLAQSPLLLVCPYLCALVERDSVEPVVLCADYLGRGVTKGVVRVQRYHIVTAS